MTEIELIKGLLACGVPDDLMNEVMRLQMQSKALEERRRSDRDRQKRKTSRESREITGITVKKGLPHTPSKEITPSSFLEEESKKEGFPTKEDLNWAVEEWNELADDMGLPKVIRMTEPRRRQLALRLRELGSREAWTQALFTIARSKFCCGENDRGWRANFDFVLRSSSLTKLVEGNYTNGKIH